MDDRLVLTFDMGTQSGRALLIDSRGQLLAKAQKKYDPPYYSKEPGYAEQDPEFYWQAICETSRQLREEHPDLWARIMAVTITTIRNTVLIVDKEGKPVRDVILWCDQRVAYKTPPLPASKRAVFAAIGMTDTIELQRKSAHCNWLKYHRPKAWAKADKFITISTYLIHHFTGEFVDADASQAGHLPFNNAERRWQKPGELTRCLFDIEPEKLCKLVKPGTVLGRITAKAAEETGIPEGIEVIASGPDKGCETLGLSCNTPEKAAISFGTTATIETTINKYLEPIKFIPPYPAVKDGWFNPEIQIFRGYWLISWFKKEFAAKEVEQAKLHGTTPEELLNKRLREVPPGCGGLMFQPFFNPSVNMPTARGSIVGFDDTHTRIHIYRAIIEGINFELINGLKQMEKRGGFQVKELFVAGGGSQSDEICQITANMFGLPVHRIQTYEVCGLGSSMVAFVAKGVYRSLDEATEHMVHIRDTFEPDMKEHQIYEKLRSEVVNDIFPRLMPLYKKADIYHKQAVELINEAQEEAERQSAAAVK